MFTQQSSVQRGGLSYRTGGEGRDALSAQIGVDLQHERLEGEQAAAAPFSVDRTFWPVLPSARLRLPLAAGQRLDLDYRARTQTPSAMQLQDLVDNSNPLLLTSGNPALSPATTHALCFHYTDAQGGSVLSTLASGFYSADASDTSVVTATDDTVLPSGVVLSAGARLTTPLNVDGALNGRALVSYGRPVRFLASNANVSLGTSFTQTPGLVDGANNVADRLGVGDRFFLGSALSPRLMSLWSMEPATRLPPTRPRRGLRPPPCRRQAHVAAVERVCPWHRRPGAPLLRPRHVRRPYTAARRRTRELQVPAARPRRGQPQRLGPLRLAARRGADGDAGLRRGRADGGALALYDAQPAAQVQQLLPARGGPDDHSAGCLLAE